MGFLKYSLKMRVIHWFMALVVLGLIAVGWFMTGLDEKVSYRLDLYGWHKSFGVLALLFFGIRLVVRFFSDVPELPSGLKRYEKKLSHAVHYTLYVLLFVVPLFGIMMSQMYGYPVHFFGIKLPMLFAENKAVAAFANQVHEILAYTLLAVVVLHVVGVIKHRFFDQKENDVLPRMW